MGGEPAGIEAEEDYCEDGVEAQKVVKGFIERYVIGQVVLC